MTNQVLETLLSSQSDYFLIQFTDTHKSEQVLVLIAITDEIRKIINGKDIDTITYKDVEALKKSYIDTNIYINANFPPFQTWQNLLGRANYIYPMNEVMISTTLKDILNSGVNTIWEFRKYFNLMG